MLYLSDISAPAPADAVFLCLLRPAPAEQADDQSKERPEEHGKVNDHARVVGGGNGAQGCNESIGCERLTVGLSGSLKLLLKALHHTGLRKQTPVGIEHIAVVHVGEVDKYAGGNPHRGIEPGEIGEDEAAAQREAFGRQRHPGAEAKRHPAGHNRRKKKHQATHRREVDMCERLHKGSKTQKAPHAEKHAVLHGKGVGLSEFISNGCFHHIDTKRNWAWPAESARSARLSKRESIVLTAYRRIRRST